MNTSDNSSHFLSLVLPKIFLDLLSWCPPLPFIAILPLPPAILLLAGFRGYLSKWYLLLPFLDHEDIFLGVFLLVRSVIQHLMWLTLGRENSLMQK